MPPRLGTQKYKLTAFAQHMLNVGAKPSTVAQYTSAIRQLLISTEKENGEPGWQDFERVLAYYRTLHYAMQTKLCAAWAHFLTYTKVTMPPLTEDRRKYNVGARGREPARLQEKPETADEVQRRRSLDYEAAKYVHLRKCLVEEGVEDDTNVIATLLSMLYWDNNEAVDPNRWFLRTDAQPFLYSNKARPIVEGYRGLYYGEDMNGKGWHVRPGDPFLVAKPRTREPREVERIVAYLQRPVTPDAERMVASSVRAALAEEELPKPVLADVPEETAAVP